MGGTAGQALPGIPIAAPVGGGNSIRGTSSASAQAAAQQQVQSSSGNRGSTTDPSRSNQSYHSIAQADVNRVEDEQNAGWERTGSSSTNSRSRNVNSPSSLGDEGQASVGTPISTPIGAGRSISGTSSAYAQATARQQVQTSSGNRGSTTIPSRSTTNPSRSTTNPSRSNQSDHSIAQVDVNPTRDEQNPVWERTGSSSTNSRSRNVNSPSLGDEGQASSRNPIATPIGAGKSISGTSSAYTQATARQQVQSSSGNRGSTTNPSRSNQSDDSIAQVDVNPIKDEQNPVWDRTGSSSTNSRLRNVNSPSSLGDEGQTSIRTPISTPIGAGKSIPGTSSTSAQAAAQQQVQSSSGNRGSTTNPSRSNQSGHSIAQVDVNPAKDPVWDRTGSSSTNLRSRNVNSPSSLGTEGQTSIRNPIASPISAGKSIPGASSAYAPATARQQVQSSSGNRGSTTNPSRFNQSGHYIAQVDVNPAKDEEKTGWEKSGSRKKSSTSSRSSSDDSSDSSSSLGDTENQAPVETPIAAPIGGQSSRRSSTNAQAAAHDAKQRIETSSGSRGVAPDRSRSNQPDHSIVQIDDFVNPPKNKQNAGWERAGLSRKSSTNSRTSSSDVESVDYSDDDIYEDAGAATPRFKEALTQEEHEALLDQQFQKQQEAHRQMYMQQQQLLEVAQALAPALQQASDSATNLDHHYRKLWNRANAQSEELQRRNHRLLDDNRSLTHELEAVKAQLAKAEQFSEVLMVLAAPKSLSEVRGKALKVDTTDVGQKANEEEIWDMPGGPDVLLTAAATQKVDVLNAEVRRVVAELGRVLQKTKFEEGNRQIMQITEKARLMLGENMVALLSAGLLENARLDSLLVQVVLQVAITNWCKTTVSSWKPGNSDVSNVLVELYSKIREVGKSASTFGNNPPLRQKYLSFQKIKSSTVVGDQ